MGQKLRKLKDDVVDTVTSKTSGGEGAAPGGEEGGKANPPAPAAGPTPSEKENDANMANQAASQSGNTQVKL